MRRGDLVTVVLPGALGKPRPALVIQSDQFAETLTVIVLPVSGTLVDAPLVRLDVKPDPANSLQKPSQIMVDKPMTVKRDKLGKPFGRLDDQGMVAVNRALALVMGLA